MLKLLRATSRRMTTIISALVISSIIVSVGAVSATIFLTLREQAVDAGRIQQETNLRAAATVLERSLLGARLIWSDANEVEAFKVFVFPAISDDTAITAVTSITGQHASILRFQPETQTFVAESVSMSGPAGEEVDVAEIVIDANSAAGLAMMEGHLFYGETELFGTRYYGAMLPISNLRDEVLGAIHVLTPIAEIEASANAVLVPIALVGGLAILGLGIVGLVASRHITKPIPRLAVVMRKIAEGQHDTEVPYAAQENEIGDMARAVEILRESAARVSQMTEAEAARVLADQEKRAEMMAELQAAFGAVVDAALDGDFSRRVDAQFSDKELNALAASINELVDGFGRGMDELVQVLSAMAGADLTARMEGSYRGAFSQLKDNVNSLADKFADVIGELKTASAALKAATGEILSGANDLSERTTRQAATIEEASASMEQLSGMVAQNAQRATEASQNAGTVTEAATRSGETMTAADEAMDRIRASSDKISNIIGLIDDIAFQTNLLALNASVEAARAGDAGKGFAVVAVEVRRLAQSVAEASSEVKALIEQAASEVTAGSRLVDEASKGLETMRSAAQSNETLLGEIARDSREQASSIEDVNAAVRQLDEMTQHNAALVEETNAAIEQTGEQAAALDAIVSVFAVDEQIAEARKREAA